MDENLTNEQDPEYIRKLTDSLKPEIIREINSATETITRNLLLLSEAHKDVDELFELIGDFQLKLKQLKIERQ
jgi:hypothetical protein